MLACDETAVLKETKCHFMDLKFMWDCNYKRHPLHRKKNTPEYIAKHFDDWPNSGVSFAECELVFDGVHSHRAHEHVGWSCFLSDATSGSRTSQEMVDD
ncbi:unnamed protein product [Urochloa humidicola]